MAFQVAYNRLAVEKRREEYEGEERAFQSVSFSGRGRR